MTNSADVLVGTELSRYAQSAFAQPIEIAQLRGSAHGPKRAECHS
jgi:hypothetical protein